MNKKLLLLSAFLLLTFSSVMAQNWNISNSNVSTCTGNFFDSGGNGGNYQSNENYTMTFCSSTSGQCIRLSFSAFALENNFDFLRIYNGPNTASPLIGTYTGATSPGTVTGTTGCITLQFTSDGSITSTGWQAAISCVACGGGPCGSTCNGGPAPANDACSGSRNLGLLPVPSACPAGIGTALVVNTTNLCATAEVPYTSMLGCQPAGNMANPAADVWYTFNITGPTLIVNIAGMQTPQVGLYSGSGCNNLIARGCGIGANGNLNTTFGGLAPGQYWLQVSGGSPNDQCNFTLTMQNNFDCAGCVIQSSLTVNPPPVNGTYRAGQTVNFCYTITDYNQTSINWLHAVTPTFGPGWNQSTLSTVLPANCSGAGVWEWFPGLVTSSATGLVTGPGFFYESPLGSPGGVRDNNPGNNFGDNNGANLCDWQFCWTVTTVPPAQCINGTSLNISIDTYGDGESGSWTSFACSGDPITQFFATLACCTPADVIAPPIRCPGGTTSATANGQGTSPWNYTWRNGAGNILQTANNVAGSNTLNNLSAGTYSVTVSDNSGCTSTTSVVIAAPVPVTATGVVSNGACSGSANGSITVTPAGGTGPYTYAWTPNVGTSATVNNLAAGAYTVTVTDANGCTGTQAFNIATPTPVTASTSATAVLCNGGSTGTATAVAGGGTGPYTYRWTPTGGTTATATGLTTGIYTVTVTDSRGCTSTATAQITQPFAISATMATPTSVRCNGGNTGAATVIAGGGTAPFTYSWTPSGGTAATATGLSAGTYTVTVTDSRGCTRTANVTIAQPPPLTSTITNPTGVTCNGGNNGSASVTAAGGKPGYAYSWSPSGGNGSTASGLAGGTYTVTVTDANGCTSTTTTTITQPAVLGGAVTPVPSNCNGANTGSATIAPAGGTGPYTYNWLPSGGNGATASGLTAGTYTVIVTDSKGCTKTLTTTVSEPSAIVPVTSSTDANCGSSNGTATVTVTGGTGPYNYQWSPSGGNGSTATGLSAGAYQVTVTDSHGCTETGNVAISNPGGPSVNILSSTDVSCAGGSNGSATATATGGAAPLTYSWSPIGGSGLSATNLPAGTYAITVLDALGCNSTTNVVINEPNPLTAAISASTNVRCAGGNTGSATVLATGGTPNYAYNWQPSGGSGSSASNLSAANYTVTVTDASGCTAQSTISIVAPAALTVSTIPTNITCNGANNGSATVTTGGGTAPYSYNWTPSGGNSASAGGLASGSYTVTVTDAQGCTITSVATITQPAAVTLSTTPTDVSCNGQSNGSITSTTGGGTAPYSYTWTPSGGTGSTANNLGPGNYTVTMTDARGCTATSSATINQPVALTASLTSNNVLCHGGTTGNATVTAGGGSGALTYSWSPSGGTGSTASNLAAGNYTVTVSDANHCTTTAAVSIYEPPALTSVITSSTMVVCNGASTGSATVTAGGGTGTLAYNWTPSGGNTNAATGLNSGNYTVTVTDANGCTNSAAVSITQPPPLVLNTSSTPAYCGVDAGTATATVSGGVGPYSYLWTPTGDVIAHPTGMPGGSHIVEVTDAQGCIQRATVNIASSTAPIALASVTANVRCNGGSNGSATVSISQGTSPFSISWSPSGGSGTTASGLPSGYYTVTATDAHGCTTQDNVTITEPAEILLNATSSDLTCNGIPTGIAQVSVSGGIPGYSYNWTPSGGTADTARNLAAGIYTVRATDAMGCTMTATTTISQPSAINLSVSSTAVRCNGASNGSATVTPSGGTTGYTYVWAPSGGAAATATGLNAGNYTVTVTDAHGCTSTSTTTVSQPAALTAQTTATDARCSGVANGTATVTVAGGSTPFSYAWSPSGGSTATATGLGSGTYTVTVTDANGCTQSATASINQPTAMTLSASSTPAACNGASSGSATASVSGGTSGYSYSWSPSGGNSAVANGLIAGTYTVTVTDASGCTSTANATVTEPTLLSAQVNSSNVLCNGATNGTATVNASGGTSGYTFAWSPAGGTGSTANGLAGGTYTVTVTDAHGCTSTASTTVGQPAAISLTASATPALCNGSLNGSVAVSANGGTSGYTYTWSPSGGTNATASGLGTGLYTVTVTDANGCTSTASASITQPTSLSAQVSSTNALCNGGSTGSATVNASGGTTGYTYTWNPSGGTAAAANGLVAGNYTVTVTDAHGCTKTATAAINQPAALSVTSASTPAHCNGASDGTATVTPTGGTAAYSYSWSPSGGNASTASGLGAGVYTVTVTDANGCTMTSNTTVTQPTPLTAQASATNVLCNGATNGTASVNASGGTTGYTYFWSPSGGTGSNANNLPGGTYTVTVTDANGCTQTSSTTVNQPSPLTLLTTPSPATCNGSLNGTATVSANGGTAGYSYLWSPSGGAASSASGLAAGTYTVTVTDANSCTSTASATITQPVVLTAQTSSTNALCNGGNTGSATVNATGGTTGYTYLWSPSGGTAAIASGLAAGSYTVTVTDAHGCTKSATALVNQPSLLNVTATPAPARCNGAANGSATVTATGGTTGYSYSWSPSGGNAATASGLTAGTYTVTVTDANGCTSTSIAVVTQPTLLAAQASSTNVLCHGAATGTASVNASGGTTGYTYSWSPSGGTGSTASGLVAGTYSVTVTDANGCSQSATATVQQPTTLSLSSSATAAQCFGALDGTASVSASGGSAGYTYNWLPSGGTAANATGLGAGVYNVTVTDANGCTSTTSATITQPVVLTAQITSTNALCNGVANGSATVNPAGGTVAYTYSWNPSGGTNTTATGLAAGNYLVTVTDAHGCTRTASATINQPTALSITASSTPAHCNGAANGTATVGVNGGTAGYTYSWSPSGGNGSAANGLAAGTYTVTVTDANNCTASTSTSITQPTVLTAQVTPTNALCNGAANGSATVVAAGSTAPYTYSWSPSGGFSSTANGLAAGTYTVTVTDLNGCTKTATSAISQPTALSLSVTGVPARCNGSSNGSATVTVSGGTAGYSYAWTPSGGTGSSATGLMAGNYTIAVTDAHGCSATATTSITQPTVLIAQTASTNARCFAASNGTATVNPSGGTGPYTYLWSPSGGNGVTASSLAAGTYTVTVTDANACTQTAIALVNQPAALSLSTVSTPARCNGAATGTATVTATGGTTSYTYSWTPSGGSGAIASGLAAGNYTVTVTDANGCSSTHSTTVSQPTVLAAQTASTPALCNGNNNGSATVNASGGTGPYTYAWTPSGGTGATANTLTAGNYTVTVSDANGCTRTASASITQPVLLTVSAASSPALCNGSSNGSATATATGGTTGYTYSWFPSGGASSQATNLAAGNYTVTVTDTHGCSSSASTIVNQPAAMVLQTSSTPATCGTANGSATVTASGGAGGYTYSWSGGGGTSATASSLNAGAHTVTVTDANGCRNTAVVNVPNTGGPTIAATVNQHVSCTGGNNGSATVSVSSGTAPYTYAWSPNGGTLASASGLSSGTYIITVTDANGCISAANVTITQPQIIVAQATSAPALCPGGSSGSATVNATGGTGPYTYSWSPAGGSGITASGLASGNYTVTVTDIHGCTKTATTSISQPPVLTVSATPSPARCNGSASGSATATANGGTSGYSYTWSPSGGSAALATNLAAGTYTVTVTDAHGCTSTNSTTINQPVAIALQTASTPATCGSASGSASVTASGGAGSFLYSWTPGGATSATATGLLAGAYTVTVTDANNCTNSAAVNVANTGGPTVSTNVSQQVACHGGNNGAASVTVSSGTAPYTYLWSPSGGTLASATGLPAGNYTVSVRDGNGCLTSANVTLTQPSSLTAQTTPTHVRCFGTSNGSATVTAAGGIGPYTYSWSPSGGSAAIANGLIPGNYTVLVTDGHACTVSSAITITQPPALALQTAALPASCTASNGSASVNASGGSGNYSYVWSPGTGTTAAVTGLATGSYTVVVTDANGCSASATANVGSSGGATIAANTTQQVSCNGGTNGAATVIVSSGNPPYSYHWSPSGGAAATATGLTAGGYTISVTDANGCVAIATVTITQPASIALQITSSPSACGASNGSASVTASGGTGTFSYAWSPGGGSSPTVNGIPSGTYTVTVTDASGCTNTARTTVANTGGPTVTSSILQSVSCAGSSNGSASVNASGGTAPYSYSWSPSGGSAATANGLSAGNYIVSVTDASGCISTASITLSQPQPVSAQTTSNPALCSGAANGSVTVAASGGTGPYSYAWSPSGGTGTVANGLTAGNYSVVVTDAHGCTISASASVSQPAAMIVQTSTTPAACGSSNGSASVNTTGGAGNYSYLWSPGGGNTASVNGLAAGSYTVVVTDAHACTQSAVANVGSSGGATIAASITQQVSCHGGANGSASVNVSVGTPPYTYHWSPSGGTAASASGLSAGSYSVSVTDANGCVAIASVTMTDPASIALQTASTPSSCGSSNGSVSVIPAGGSSPYAYSWSPGGGSSASVTSLPAGTYSVTVTDAHGCTSTAVATIANTGGPTIATNITHQVSCFGGQNGSASVNVSSGTAPFTYSWAPSGGTGTTAAGLTAGTYTITVRDANGCVSTNNITITEPGAMTVQSSSANLNCNGSADGSASVVVGGGTVPYSYSWTPATGTGSAINSLSAGNYVVVISDGNGCTQSASFTITQPAALNLTPSHTDATCGGANGSASVQVTGGNNPYSYSWSPGGGTSSNATSLSAGTYTVTVSDAQGCTNTTAIPVANIGGATATVQSTTNLSCHGANDGRAAISVSGGQVPYVYHWSPAGGTSASANGLSAGAYTVTVTDANGCTSSVLLTLTEPTAIQINTSSTPAACNGGTNGTATAAVSGGFPPYQYQWSGNPGSTATIGGLAIGTYLVTITDAHGCIESGSVNVSSNTAMVLTTAATGVTCFGNSNGSASVTPAGGVTPYTYSWSPAGGTTASVSGLPAGQYVVTVTDASGCASLSSVNIIAPDPLELLASEPVIICSGQSTIITAYASGGNWPYSYQWSNGVTDSSQTVSPTSTTTYTVDVVDAHGCTTTQQAVTVTIGPPLSVHATADSVLCAGNSTTISALALGGDGHYSYTWNNGSITSASAIVTPDHDSTFTVTVTDGCGSPPVQAQVAVVIQPLPVVSFIPHAIQGCAPVHVNFINLTTAPVGSQFIWNFGDNTTGNDPNPSHDYLTPGQYTVGLSVAAPGGCNNSLVIQNLVQVNPYPNAVFTQSEQEVSQLNATISFTNNSNGGSNYNWDFGDGTPNESAPNPVHDFKDTGTYTIRLIVTNPFGCTDTTYGVVHVTENFAIYIPNAFTPNSDGVNDGFSAFGVGYVDYDMYILDRWGLNIYHTRDKKQPWNGKVDGVGEPCQNDVYEYIIRVHDFKGELHQYIGHVTLFR